MAIRNRQAAVPRNAGTLSATLQATNRGRAQRCRSKNRALSLLGGIGTARSFRPCFSLYNRKAHGQQGDGDPQYHQKHRRRDADEHHGKYRPLRSPHVPPSLRDLRVARCRRINARRRERTGLRRGRRRVGAALVGHGNRRFTNPAGAGPRPDGCATARAPARRRWF